MAVKKKVGRPRKNMVVKEEIEIEIELEEDEEEDDENFDGEEHTGNIGIVCCHHCGWSEDIVGVRYVPHGTCISCGLPVKARIKYIRG